jgi:integrase
MGTLFRRADRGGAGGKWYAEFTDHTGRKVKKSTGTTSKKDAQLILSKWETDVALRKRGVIDVAVERVVNQANRPLEDHFREWSNSVAAANRSTDYMAEHESRWLKISEYCQWRSLSDISAESFERFVAHLKSGSKSKKTDIKRSQRTVGQYVQTAKGFAAWCVRTGRINSNPLIGIRKPNPEVDRKLVRRMLLPAEWIRLAAATAEGSIEFGMAPSERRLLYEFAIQTGLRASELRSLIVANCQLAARPHPFVTVPARDTKAKTMAKQWITIELAERLAAFLQLVERSGKSTVFELANKFAMAKMLRRDLDAARAKWIAEADGDENETKQRNQSDFLAIVNHSGETLDFHALRHTCGAWLAIQNVHPKTIQSVMRHSTITLTLDTYGHLMPGSEAGAINCLSSMLAGSETGSNSTH